MPYDYIEEYQKQNDETIWEFRDKDAQSKIDISSTETDYANPLTFETMQAQLAKNTKIKLEPIQDLHGYDKPWVGGAGKNLAGITNTASSVTGVTVTPEYDSDRNFINLKIVADGTRTVDTYYWLTDHDPGVWTPFLNKTLKVYTWGMVDGLQFEIGYKLNSSDYLRYWCTYTGVDATGDKLSSAIGSEYYTLGYRIRIFANKTINTKLKMMIVESSATVTSFEPYSNICPISGHDQIDILGCGKNLLPLDLATIKSINTDGTWNNNEYILRNVKYTINTDSNGNIISISANGQANANSTLILMQGVNPPFNNMILSHGNNGGSSNNFFMGYTKKTTPYTVYALAYSTEKTIEIPEGHETDDYFLYIRVANGYNAQNVILYPMLRASGTSTTFEPYTESNSKTLPLPSTVYGGVLDLESGELVVDREYKVLTGNDVTWYDEIREHILFENLTLTSLNRSGIHISNLYVNRTLTQWTELKNGEFAFHPTLDTIIRVMDSKITSKSEAETYFTSNPLQICYELATPTTIQLTPHQLSLLKSQNTIMSSNYTQIKVTYRNGVFATLEELSDLDTNVKDISDKFNALGLSVVDGKLCQTYNT